MARAGYVKRSIGLALVMAMAGGALFVATPSSAERTTRQVKDVRSAAPKATVRAARASTQITGAGSLGSARSSRMRADDAMAPTRTALGNDEPNLEPWSLIAGALAVMAFLARHRRAD